VAQGGAETAREMLQSDRTAQATAGPTVRGVAFALLAIAIVSVLVAVVFSVLT
jgi:hypothetical protein